MRIAIQIVDLLFVSSDSPLWVAYARGLVGIPADAVHRSLGMCVFLALLGQVLFDM